MKKIVTLIFILISFYHVSAQLPTNGLLAYYPLDGNANDASGNSNNGTVNGPTSTTDRFGNPNKALLFNGTTDYVNCGTNPLLAPTTTQDLTIAVWVNPSFNDNPVYAKIICARSDAYVPSNSNFYSAILIENENKFRVRGCNAIVVGIDTETQYSFNNWYHLTFVYKAGENNSKLYINGQFVAQATINYNANVSTSPFMLGRTLDTGNFNDPIFFKGKMDDMAIYNRALTSTEIAAIATLPITVSVNDNVLCTGETGTLTATGCTGTITWTGGGTPNGSTLSVNQAGTYTATCTVTSGGQDYSANDSGIVSINPPVSVSVNDLVLCTGNIGTLTATGCSGTITWTGGGTSSGSTLSVNTAGTYTAICKVTLNEKECSASVQGVVKVNPPITVSVNNIEINSGNAGTLTASGCTGSVTWAGGGTQSGSTLLVNAAGTYIATCKVTANGKECSANALGIVTIVMPANYVEFGLNNTRNPSAIFDAQSNNKGILLPRIDYNNRPTTNLVSGLLIYVIANGPQGNNCFYYYNGTSWVKLG